MVCVCVCMCACMHALEEEKKENKKERKREREVWYHQLNNPPTQILVLSLRPSVSFPTVVRWFSAFSFLFFPFSVVPVSGINLFVSQPGNVSPRHRVKPLSLRQNAASSIHLKSTQRLMQQPMGEKMEGKEMRVNVTKWKSPKKTDWPRIYRADVHTFIMLLINSQLCNLHPWYNKTLFRANEMTVLPFSSADGCIVEWGQFVCI